jgi:purine-cytosine permease-like protein
MEHSLSTGMSGPLVFGLGLRDSSLVIIFFGLATSFFAPYFSIFGARLGLRQMIHTRYAFGFVISFFRLSSLNLERGRSCDFYRLPDKERC